jgi:5-methyltetrahydrofolate--homocysteine methyltransferase
MSVVAQLSEALQRGDDARALELTKQAIAAQLPAADILQEGLIAGMAVVGQRFRDYEIYLPDVLLAARAMQTAVDELKPLFLSQEVPRAGRVVLGTVRGDMHDIGKNLVGIMLTGAGFEIIDLGKDVAPARFIEAALDEGASVIGMSALLTTTAPAMAEVSKMLQEQGLGEQIKTIAGGAPMSESLSRELGVDAYAFDAMNAVDRIRDLVQEVS